jgi:4-hydroxybenzoate polyprenyltransferase
MLYTIVGVLILLWLIGFIAHIGGAFVHVLLVVAAVVFLYHLLTGRHTSA